MSKSQNVKNGKIEFLRFIFSIIIVLHHSRFLLGDEISPFLGGSFAVEFFFIVSGYLMMSSIEKCARGGDKLLVGRETLCFITKKVKNIMPQAICSWIIAFIFISITQAKNIKEMLEMFIDSFWELWMLEMSGLPAQEINGVVWYISSMLLCMAILYPLIRKFPDEMLNIVVPLTILFVLGYLCQEIGTPRNPSHWLGITYKGNLRALSEICIGVLCYQITKNLKKTSLSCFGKILVTILETGIYFTVISYMYFFKASRRDYFFLALLAFGVILSFSGRGVFSAAFNHSLCFFLGKMSMALFFSHTFFAKYLNEILPSCYTNILRMSIYIGCTIFTSILVMTVVHVWKRKEKYVIEKIKYLVLLSQ